MQKLMLYISKQSKENSLLIIIIFSIAFLILLSLIVYANALTEKRISGSLIKVYTSYTSVWITDGFWKYFGFFYNPTDLTRTWHTGPYIYGTVPGWYLYPPYIAQYLNYFFTDSIEPKFIAFYGVLSSFIAGITLTYLAYKIADILVPKYYSIKIVLSIICFMVFVTFPHNLFLIYMPTPQINFITFSCLFFIKFIDLFEKNLEIKKIDIAHLFVVSLLMSISEYVASFLFQFSFLAMMFYTFKYNKFFVKIIAIFILSGLTFLLIKQTQTSLAIYFNPAVDFLSSGALSRTGLDGSTLHYTSHWDLILSRHPSGMYPATALPKWYMNWPVIFITSILSLLGIIYFELRKQTIISFILFTGYSSYALYAFIFSNAVVLHSDIYDVILFAPVVLTVFAVLPAYVYKITNSALILPIWITVGISYVFVQLRAYTVAFPPI